MDSKRRKLASVSGQTSISGFFNSPEKQVKNSNKKSSSKKDKAKSRKGRVLSWVTNFSVFLPVKTRILDIIIQKYNLNVGHDGCSSCCCSVLFE